MQKFYEALFDQLQARHRELLNILDELPPEAYDWKPVPEMNSMAVLIFHMTGGERYWIGDVVHQEDSHRDRDAEFKVSGLSREALKQRITDLEAYEKTVLEGMKIEQLDEERLSPRHEKKYSVAWGLMHALEHTSEHVGHIHVMKDLWNHGKTGVTQ
jgi:uncharacterized damage-inducible protein DinB